jgi:hypothetical protein
LLVNIVGKYSDIIKNVDIKRFRKKKASYQLIATILFFDGSILHIKEYLFLSGERKYAYHWLDANEKFLGRWDNAPHWPRLERFPNHFHDSSSHAVVATDVKDLNAVLAYIRKRIITE